MIVVFALVIGTLGAAPDGVQPIPVSPDDCIKGKILAPPAPKPRPKSLTVQHKPKRLFKADPKPKVEEEPCATLPPAPPFTFIEFPPLPDVPLVSIPPIEPSMPPEFATLPPPPDEPWSPPQCGCFSGGGYGGFGGSGGGGVPSTPTAPVPEPATWLAIVTGLLAVRLRTKPKKVDFLPSRK